MENTPDFVSICDNKVNKMNLSSFISKKKRLAKSNDITK
jgi:hypothetical protein